MKETTNYNLKKIELTDSPPDITVINPNWDAIDVEMKRQDTARTTHEAESVSIADITYYVSTTGHDSNDGSSGSPFRTIQHAINKLPKCINHTVTINVTAGTYAEDVKIYSFIGSGRIVLNGGTDLATAANFKVNSIHCKSNIILTRINGFTATTTTGSAFAIESGFWGEYNYCSTIVSATSQLGFVVANALARLTGCQSSNKAYGLLVTSMSTVASVNWSAGVGNLQGIMAQDASTVGKTGVQPQGVTAEITQGGSVIR